MSALAKIQAAGFTVSPIGDGLAVTPASQLSAAQRDYIAAHKSELLAELTDDPRIAELMAMGWNRVNAEFLAAATARPAAPVAQPQPATGDSEA